MAHDTSQPESTEGSPPAEFGRRNVYVQGVWWPYFVNDTTLNAIKTFDVRDDDVWIATWPKAGTSQVGQYFSTSDRLNVKEVIRTNLTDCPRVPEVPNI